MNIICLLLYSTPITLAKRYLRFYSVIGLTRLIKLARFLYLIFAVLYHFSCIDVNYSFLVHCTYSRFSKLPLSLSWILKCSQNLSYLTKIQFTPISTSMCKIWLKIWRSAAELLRILDFQNGGCPPSCIWYDVIEDDPRLVFDGPNMILKLHADCIYTLQDIAIFIFGPFGLKLPIHAAPFWGVFGDISPWMNSYIVANPKRPSLGENTSYEP